MGLDAFLDILACPVCRGTLARTAAAVRCDRCDVSHPFVSGTDSPVLLPSDASFDEPPVARRMKAHVHERFSFINQSLASPAGAFATFLNLGYVPTAAAQYAVRGPVRSAFNTSSTTLLFEVLGTCEVEGRTVVEVGSGRGGNLALIQQHCRPKRVVGVDLSEANVAFSSRAHTFETGGFVVGDAEHVPLRDRVADVVINLESSHYYPDLERFFKEVARVLVGGGEFLYADVLPVDRFEVARRCLDEAGFVMTRDQDISDNVILACEAAARRRQHPRFAEIYRAFDVVPGSSMFEALRAGVSRYKVMRFARSERC